MVPSSYSRFSTFAPEVSSTVTSTTTTVSSSSPSLSSMGIGYSQSFITSTPSNISFTSQPVNSKIFSFHPTALVVSSFPSGSLASSTSMPAVGVSSLSSTPGDIFEVQLGYFTNETFPKLMEQSGCSSNCIRARYHVR